MSLERVVRKAWREHRLMAVLLELTYRCNLDCFFCYNDLGARGEPLSRARYLALLAELADLGVLHLTFSGGEPLAHPDFLLLGAAAREHGFVVRIKSNGHALRGELARRVRDEVDPFVVELSLHGATAAVHDRQTRVPGSFDRLLANVAELQALGLRLKLNATLTAWNEHEIEPMLDLAAALGLPLQIDPQVTPRDDGGRTPLSIAPSPRAVERLFAVLAARTPPETPAAEKAAPAPPAAPCGVSAPPAAPRESAGEKHCGAGSAGIAVDPYGNVYPCVQWRRPVGNLHRATLREIWETSTGLSEVRSTTVAAKRVVDAYGPAGVLLNFCPGTAAAHGDPLAVYPGALERMTAVQAALAAAPGRVRLPVVS